MKTFMLLLFSLFAVNAVANNSGMWFDPDQSGHGISLFEWNSANHEMPDGVVFWWYTYDNDGNQLWLMSSLEESALDMTFDLYAPTASAFPTADDVDVGEVVGVATLSDNLDGTLEFSWEIVSPVTTCADVYGFVPPGPLDPRCRNENDGFSPGTVLDEGLGLEEEGAATFQRLTPQ